MPNLVGDDLVFRGLLHKADLLTLCALLQFIQRRSFKQNPARFSAVRGQRGFQLPEQGALAAAGGAAEHHKFSLPDGQAQIVDGFCLLFRIGKTQVSYCKCFHFLSSILLRNTGVRHKAR